jgi:phosphohistidine swiveling domain-containing protein
VTSHPARTPRWRTAVARPNTPLFLSFLISGQDLAVIQRWTGLSVGFEQIRREGIRLQYDGHELDTAAAEIRARASDGADFFNDFADRCVASCDDLLATSGRVAAAHAEEPTAPGAFGTAAQLYFDSAIRLASFLQTLIVVQNVLDEALHDFVIERGVDGDAVDAVKAALKLALTPTDELRNLSALMDIAIDVQETVSCHRSWIDADPIEVTAQIAYELPDLWQQVLAYSEQFGWMGRRYYSGTPVTPIDVVMRLQNLLRHNCAERRRAATRRSEAAVAGRNEAIDLLGGDVESRYVADVLSRYMFLRSHRLDTFFKAHEPLIPFFTDLGSVVGIGYDDIPDLAWQELVGGLRQDTTADQLRQLAGSRRPAFGFRSVKGETTWLPGAPEQLKRAVDEGLTIEGTCASPGSVKGRVRVVRSDDDMYAMDPGEVLVTTMTIPRLMLAVEKASAIVTDEGGILCHAAIVSREFGLPCIIGTGDASTRLRTGDIVDVNSNPSSAQVLKQTDTTDHHYY